MITPIMPRNVINRSISFDPVLFEALESKLSALNMSRSDFINRCIRNQLLTEKPFVVTADADRLVSTIKSRRRIKK